MKRRILAPTADHNAFMDKLKAAMLAHKDAMPLDQMLAVASQFIGILLSVQDQTKGDARRYMEMVARNIEIGNTTAVETMLGSTDGEA